MIKIKQAVIVEGKYDLIKLSSMIDALIIPTNGFRIFKDKSKREFIKTVAEKNGIIILTDSDAAGFKIRGYLSSFVPQDRIKHAYIPNIYGKEKRKDAPSKEGLLGVEGVDEEVIMSALKRAGIFAEPTDAQIRKITKFDMYSAGLSGQINSNDFRRKFLKSLRLPERMSSNALLNVLNSIMTYDEFLEHINKL